MHLNHPTTPSTPMTTQSQGINDEGAFPRASPSNLTPQNNN